MSTGELANGITNLRQWPAGMSGNPRGRPKRDYDVAKLARSHTREAISTLVSIMADHAAPHSARVSAAQTLLDRGWGKAPQALDLNRTISIAEAFEEFVRQIRRNSDVIAIDAEADGGHADQEVRTESDHW